MRYVCVTGCKVGLRCFRKWSAGVTVVRQSSTSISLWIYICVLYKGSCCTDPAMAVISSTESHILLLQQSCSTLSCSVAGKTTAFMGHQEGRLLLKFKHFHTKFLFTVHDFHYFGYKLRVFMNNLSSGWYLFVAIMHTVYPGVAVI